MRIWITEMGEVDTGATDPRTGEPLMSPRPRGMPLSVDRGWAVWPVEDDPDTPLVEAYVVAIGLQMDTAPTWGHDLGDPWSAAYHTDPLGAAATDTLEAFFGFLEPGELAGATRAEVVRTITQDENAVIGCTGAHGDIRLWSADTRKIRPFRRRADRRWWETLNKARRNKVWSLTDAQRSELLAAPVPDRLALLQAY